MTSPTCIFCKIIAGEINAYKVYEDDACVVFLDNGPLFAGHCLIAPRQHVETLMDLPDELIQPLFANARMMAKAVERGLDAQGSFIAINNRISQSVPHLHVHVVPRRPKDGLKGFFWPRRPYANDAEMAETRDKLRAAVDALKAG